MYKRQYLSQFESDMRTTQLTASVGMRVGTEVGIGVVVVGAWVRVVALGAYVGDDEAVLYLNVETAVASLPATVMTTRADPEFADPALYPLGLAHNIAVPEVQLVVVQWPE